MEGQVALVAGIDCVLRHSVVREPSAQSKAYRLVHTHQSAYRYPSHLDTVPAAHSLVYPGAG